MNHPFASCALLIVLASCGAAAGDPQSTGAPAASAALLAAVAPPPQNDHHVQPKTYETTSVDNIPAFTIGGPFTYIVNRVAASDDKRLTLYTVIPHDAGTTFKLVNQKRLDDHTYGYYFQEVTSTGLAKGLMVHTLEGVPAVVDGFAMTDIQVAVLAADGSLTPDPGGTPSEARRRNPRHLRTQDAKDVDPNMPTEDVTIYLNGGKSNGDRYITGFAFVYGLDEALTLKDVTASNTVEFALKNAGGPFEFLFFDHKVNAFGTNDIETYFPNGDGDAGTAPRWNMMRN